MVLQNVYEQTQERLGIIFKEFDNIYISFSGGKDSRSITGFMYRPYSLEEPFKTPSWSIP